MTEHPGQITPGDGDGLLPCPFCGSPNIDPEGWMSVSQDGSEKKTGPACDECGGSTESVERWNERWYFPDDKPRATRDAAEGADPEHGVECSECGDTLFGNETCTSVHCGLKAAPPKPAPDAMRPDEIPDSALWALIAVLHSNVDEDQRPMSWSDFSDEQADRLKRAAAAFLAALAAPAPPATSYGPTDDGYRKIAPVPPADGALCPKCGITLASDETCASVACPIQGDNPLPSGAEAAEPDLREVVHDKMRGMLAEAQPNHPALATPPVRGDREALDQQLEAKLDDYWKGRPGPSLAGLIQWWRNERASLHVQPGAGEPSRGQVEELLREYFAAPSTVFEQCVTAVHSLFRDPPRQAPHSSREGGR